MTAVFKHELRSYFHSLTAYVFGAFLLAFIGIGAMLYNLQAAVSNFEYVLSFASLVFVVIVPVLTMRVLAEERRQKTDQLLYSLPITTVQIIAGKYLALLVLYLIPLAIIAVYPLIFAQFGDVYLLTSYGSILAFFLLGAALIAVGVFLSSLTDNQGLAAGLGIAVILLNYYSVSLSEYVSSTPVGALAALLVLILAVGAVVRYDDIYLSEPDMYTYSYNTSFDGEGAITSAIDYVVNAEQPQLYRLEGHGESELPSTFQDQLEKANMELHDLSLLTVDAIPEDAACLLIYAPTSDISGEERDMLADYVTGGGKLLVMAGPVDGASLDNLYSLLSEYGVTANEGIVIESDREHYAFQAPFALLPDLASSAITDSLIDERYFPILPLSLGLTVGEDTNGATVTPLLTTSDASYSKLAGYELDTYDKEEGDLDGPFTLAVSVEAGSGQMVWFSSSAFLDDKYNALSSGANVNLGMNALSSLVGESEAMAIRSKSLNYNYLTISASTSSLLKVLMIGIVPLAYLGVGIAVVVKRRRMQNEAV